MPRAALLRAWEATLVDRGMDQAHGLRRMFAPGRPRVVQIVAGREGVGRTSVAVNLAVALAQAGRDTLLIEASRHAGEARALDYLGLDAPGAWAAAPARPLEIPATEGLAVWPLDLAARAHDVEPSPIPARLPGRTRLPDCVLVTSACGRSLVWTGEHESHEVLIVLSRAAASITDAYALIKRMSLQGMQTRFHVLVNRVGSEDEARLIFGNMASVARGYLDVQLQLCGFVPADEALGRAAAQGRSVLDTEPDSPATRAFRRLAEFVTKGVRPAAGSAMRKAPVRLAASL
jgi:flagellar biosynthesis protein FlhG